MYRNQEKVYHTLTAHAFDNVDIEALHLARHARDLQEELLHHDDDQRLK
jgi:hypothetical protein